MKNSPAQKRTISVKEVMRRLDCGRCTVYRMMKDGTLDPAFIRSAHRVRIDSVNKVASGGVA